MLNNNLETNIKKRNQVYIIIALISLYIFWGGTYLGMKIAIETLPPFIMAGIRFLSAGVILYIWARASGAERPKKIHWKNAGVIGALLLLGGNGVVAWAEQLIPSGIAALLVATVPLWIIILNWFNKNEEKPNRVIVIGTLLGFIGITVLVLQPGGMTTDTEIHWIGIIALLFATLSWSIGSLYSRRANLPESHLLSIAIQMLVGGGLLLVVSFLLGEWSKFSLSNITIRSYIAMGYLILFGSIIAYNAYLWLLKNAEPAWVSTYAFVNPIIAVLLGWVL
ncbi:MAG: EamA family transporter, partial [Desulfobacterales bacterium]|nr:EamA family transporter [Desulfobacterales bacterium]